MPQPTPKPTSGGTNLWPGAGGNNSGTTGTPSTQIPAVGSNVTAGKVTIAGFGNTKSKESTYIGGYVGNVSRGNVSYGDVDFYSASDIKNLFTKLQYNGGKKKPDKRLTDWMKSIGVTNIKVAKEIWNDAATYAANLAKSGQNVSFFDVINSTAFQSTGLTIPKSLVADSASSGPQTQKYISVTAAADARAQLRSAMLSTLYRTPTEEEYTKYIQELNTLEQKPGNFKQVTYYPDGRQVTTGADFDRGRFLTNFVLRAVDFTKDLEGVAGQTQDSVNQLINANGLKGFISDTAARQWMKQLVSGETTLDQINSNIRAKAGTIYTAFKPLMDENPTMSLTDVASPYLKVYSDMLEIPTGQLNVKDALSKASYTTDKGVTALYNVFDFEKSLRKDPRFQYTQKAAGEAQNLAYTFARSFGVNL